LLSTVFCLSCFPDIFIQYTLNRKNFEDETCKDLDDQLRSKYKSRLVYYKADGSGDVKLTEKAINELYKKCNITAIYYETDFDPVNVLRDATGIQFNKQNLHFMYFN